MTRILAAAALMALFVGEAHAQTHEVAAGCPDEPVDTYEAMRLAEVWFARGEALFQEEKHVEALAAFGCSLRMVGHPVTYYNAAQAANQAGQKEEALRLAKLSEARDHLGETGDSARRLIKGLEAELAKEKKEEAETKRGTSNGKAPIPHPCTPEVSSVELAPPRFAVLGYVALTLGGAFLLNGVIFQTLSPSRDSALQKAAIADFAVGGVGLTAGAVILIVSYRKRKKEHPLAVLPGPGNLSLVAAF